MYQTYSNIYIKQKYNQYVPCHVSELAQLAGCWLQKIAFDTYFIIACWQICPTEMRANYRYSRDYIFTANSIVMLLVPLIIISVMNLLLYLTIRR